MYKIIVNYPFANKSEPLSFNSMHEMLLYMKEHNCTVDDLLQFDYDIEEINELSKN